MKTSKSISLCVDGVRPRWSPAQPVSSCSVQRVLLAVGAEQRCHLQPFPSGTLLAHTIVPGCLRGDLLSLLLRVCRAGWLGLLVSVQRVGAVAALDSPTSPWEDMTGPLVRVYKPTQQAVCAARVYHESD